MEDIFLSTCRRNWILRAIGFSIAIFAGSCFMRPAFAAMPETLICGDVVVWDAENEVAIVRKQCEFRNTLENPLWNKYAWKPITGKDRGRHPMIDYYQGLWHSQSWDRGREVSERHPEKLADETQPIDRNCNE